MMLNKIFVFLFGVGLATILLLGACRSEEVAQENQSQNQPSATTAQPATTASEELNGSPVAEETNGGEISAYPNPEEANGETNSAYPEQGNSEQSNLLTEPPNPSFDLPETGGETGVVGGILIQEIVGEGFIPFTPYELILAEVINDTEGNPTLIGYDEDSPRAQMFPTGVFVFQDVPPGDYGIVANLAVYEFPLQEQDGSRLLITVEAGQATDLGQVITQLP